MNVPHLYMDTYGHYFRRYNGYADYMGGDYTEDLNHLDTTAVLLLIGKHISWDSNRLHKEFILSANQIVKKNPKMRFFMKIYKWVMEDRKGIGFGKMYVDRMMSEEEEEMYTAIVRYLKVVHSENQRFYRETKSYYFIPDYRSLENRSRYIKNICYSIITLVLGAGTYYIYKKYKNENYTIRINIKSALDSINTKQKQKQISSSSSSSQNDIQQQQNQQQQQQQDTSSPSRKKSKNKKKRKQITRIITSQGFNKPTEVKVIDRKVAELEDIPNTLSTVTLPTDKDVKVYIVILFFNIFNI